MLRRTGLTALLVVSLQLAQTPASAESMPKIDAKENVISLENWTTLNDTIMGGTSQAGCRHTPEGLLLEGEVVANGGGFVSCRSPLLRPPLDLSAFSGLRLAIEGEGRTLKFAVACSDGLMGLTEMIPGGLRWVTPVPTQVEGTSVVEIAFKDLQPVVRAKPVGLPLRFDSSAITRLQVLHSRFDEAGSTNPGFRAGAIRILIHSIEAYQ